MCAPPLVQTSDESLLVSQMEKHWPLLLLRINCSLILLTFDYYFFGIFIPFHGSVCLLNPSVTASDSKISLYSLFLLLTTFTSSYLVLF